LFTRKLPLIEEILRDVIYLKETAHIVFQMEAINKIADIDSLIQQKCPISNRFTLIFSVSYGV